MEHYQTNLMQAFSRAAVKPADATGSDLLEAILRERPDLRGQLAYFPAQGWSAHTIFIGDEVFKAPKKYQLFDFDDRLSHKFDREHEILAQLEGAGLPVPKITCVGRETYFYGMTRLPGVRVSDVIETMTETEKKALSKDVAEFFVGFALALPLQGGKYAHHDDFHDKNVLVDPLTKRLTGVIDFGEVRYCAKPFLPDYMWLKLEPYFLKEYNAIKAVVPDKPVELSTFTQQKEPICRRF